MNQFISLTSIIICLTQGVFSFNIPKYWKLQSSEIDSEKVLKLKLALVPKDSEKLEATLLSISSPKSEKFRKYIKSNDIQEIVGRSMNELDELSRWLDASVQTNPHRDWAFVSLSVKRIQQLFSCTLETYQHQVTKEVKVIAKDGLYNIPQNMRHIIQLVSGLNTFSAAHWSTPIATTTTTTATTTAPITPQTIYNNYQVTIIIVVTNIYNTIATSGSIQRISRFYSWITSSGGIRKVTIIIIIIIIIITKNKHKNNNQK